MKPYLAKQLPLQEVDWEQHVPLIAKANSHLARFDGFMQTIPNPELLLAPITTQEAVLSSRIEGTQATLEDIFEYDAEPSENLRNYPDIQEVTNYRTTLRFAVENLHSSPLTLNLIKDMHRILLAGVRGNNKKRGEFRTTQNWIGGSGAKIEHASFVPPSPLHLLDHLSNLERYFHYEEKEQLVQLAVIHAQFELLHPFLDGNGRIGRILIPLFLYEKKLISHPYFYISSFFEADREAYYTKLEGISRRNGWDAWIEFFLTAVISQASLQMSLAQNILDLHKEISKKINELLRSQAAIHVIDFIFSHPIFKGTQFALDTSIPKATANRLLNTLVQGNVLQPEREKTGRAGQIYRFTQLLTLLTES